MHLFLIFPFYSLLTTSLFADSIILPLNIFKSSMIKSLLLSWSSTITGLEPHICCDPEAVLHRLCQEIYTSMHLEAGPLNLVNIKSWSSLVTWLQSILASVWKWSCLQRGLTGALLSMPFEVGLHTLVPAVKPEAAMWPFQPCSAVVRAQS